jgi:thiamine pyrophosphate-dependent acetolactate synthase large subunit-like protein
MRWGTLSESVSMKEAIRELIKKAIREAWSNRWGTLSESISMAIGSSLLSTRPCGR